MFSRRFLRIKAIKAIYAHLSGAADSLVAEEKALLNGLDKTYELYFHILSLLTEVRRYAEERIEIGLNKQLPTAEDLNPNRRFVQNAVLAQIEADEQLDHILAVKKLSWNNNPELIKRLYQALVQSDYYKAYMDAEKSSYAADRKVVEDFVIETIQDDEMLLELLEEQSVNWSDDLDFILIMVLRTLSAAKQDSEKLPLVPQYKSEDDKAFVRRLFAEASVGYKDNLAIIEKFTQNWDVERIALMDNIVMTTAIAEMVNFDSIPVKVSLDEYIEIAKYYSTMGSSTFINGVLDKVVEHLTTEGVITKSGRGLVEI